MVAEVTAFNVAAPHYGEFGLDSCCHSSTGEVPFCPFCLRYRLTAAEAKLAEVSRTRDTAVELHGIASTKLVHAADAVSFYDDINDGVAIVAAVREALGLPPLGMRR